MTGKKVRKANEKCRRTVAEEDKFGLGAGDSGKVCMTAWKKTLNNPYL